jgi:Holliday junction resolvase-like predicted endonuclease
MSSSFWLLAPGWRELSQTEKKITESKAEQIYKTATIFTQNDNLNENRCHFVNLLSFAKKYLFLILR